MLATEQIAAWVGLDWAEDQHEIRLRAAGSREVERYQVRQDPEELHEWVRQLRTRFEGRPVVIALEQKRGGLMAALMCYDFLHLYPINPKTVASYREAFSPSGKKDDPEDSDLLLELVYRHRDRLRCWRPEAAQTRELALLVEGRRQLVERRKELVQQLREVLKSYYPQPLQWFAKLDGPLALEFLRRWPTLEQARKVRIDVLGRCMARHRVRCAETKLQTLLEQIRASYPLTQDEALIGAGSLKLVGLGRTALGSAADHQTLRQPHCHALRRA
jgi:transposase